MTAPLVPFWARTDVGDGIRWHLCDTRRDGRGHIMRFLQSDDRQEEPWVDEEWSPEDIRLVHRPTA